MKIIGEKLRIARQIRNKTITQLAKEVEVSKQAISQFESELSEPKGNTLLNICKSLNFPIHFFINSFTDDIEVTSTCFRALSSTTALEKNSYKEKAKLVSGIYDYLDEKLYLPPLKLPAFDLSDIITNEYIERIASQLRNYWGLGEKPIPNVIALMEENGIIVSVFKDESKRIDGFTQFYKTEKGLRYCVILDNEKHSMARRNFSASHELGHVILHSNLCFDELDSSEKPIVEKQANYFASCFLLPTKSFRKDLTDPLNFSSYLSLKLKWRVSIKAMIVRAKELGIIDYYQSVNLFKKYNYYITKNNKQGEKLEPLDETIEFEKPELFESAFEMLLEEGCAGYGYESLMRDLLERGLALYDDFLYSILPISDNFFSKYKPTSKVLNIKLKN